MNKLLSKLEDQFYVIETSNNIDQSFKLENFYCKWEDKNKVTVKIPNGTTLNDLFVEDEISKIKITNIKNQTNRLEELFLILVLHIVLLFLFFRFVIFIRVFLCLISRFFV